ncbi:hypothetical protein ACFE04_015109 [Oxalis oulophora]
MVLQHSMETLGNSILRLLFIASCSSNMQKFFEAEIEKMQVEHCSFPLFVSETVLKKEWTTPHRGLCSREIKPPTKSRRMQNKPVNSIAQYKEWLYYAVNSNVDGSD